MTFAIRALQERKKKAKKVKKREEENLNDPVCRQIHQYLQIGCKMTCARFLKP
jgi:hypothetical protein